jgi:thiamine biosynthesis lipoprotein
MGTRFELVLDGDAVPARAAGEAALHVIEHCHRRFSRFEASSLVSHIRRTAWRAPVRLDADTFALFEDALRLHTASHGAFDIAVGGDMERLGLHPPSGDDAAAGTTSASIVLDARTRTIALRDRNVGIDLGAIAKGHALDLAARVLRDAGIERALIHGGTSSVLAIGAPAGREGWAIALGHDTGPTVTLRDRALAVSGSSGRTTVVDGVDTGHIIDPRTGRGLPPGVSVAVTGPSARLCDAWATAITVLGHRPGTMPASYETFFVSGS